MSAPAEALAQTARDAGVEIVLDADVQQLQIEDKTVKAVCTTGYGCQAVSGVVASGDYHHMEQAEMQDYYANFSMSIRIKDAGIPSRHLR